MVVNDCYYRGRAKESSDVLEADAAHAQRAFEEAHEAVSNKVENPTQPTPLRDASRAAHALGVERVLVKDEGTRGGLQAFKITGVWNAVEQCVDEKVETLCTMTDGNHGVAVASVARKSGRKAVIFVPANMVKARRDALTNLGATVHVVNGSYDDAIDVVRQRAEENGWCLVSDTSWPGYEEIPTAIVAGYGSIFREIEDDLIQQKAKPVTHVLVQAGVGGLAGAAAAWLHWRRTKISCWSDNAELIIVEPRDAAACFENVDRNAMQLKPCSGATDSLMSGLNCGVPSYVTWPLIRRTASQYVLIEDEVARKAMRILSQDGIVAGESGAAGIGGALEIKFPRDSVVLVVNTEADTDPESYARIINQGKKRRIIAAMAFVSAMFVISRIVL